MNICRRLLVLVIGISLLAFVSVSDAGKKDQRKLEKRRAQEEAMRALQRGEILPLAQVLEIVAREAPGNILEIEYSAGPKYEVKVLTPDGHIHKIKLDARTGEVLKIKEKSKSKDKD